MGTTYREAFELYIEVWIVCDVDDNIFNDALYCFYFLIVIG